MSDNDVPPARARAARIYSAPDFQELTRRRGRLSAVLVTVTLLLYVGFFLVVALAPAALGHRIAGVGSVGLLLVLVLFLAAFALAWGYLRVSARVLTPMQERVAARVDGEAR